MYELFKGGIDIIFYIVVGVALVGVIVKKITSKKKDQ